MNLDTNMVYLEKEIGRDTVSSHDWSDSSDWEIDSFNSTWTLQPPENSVYVATDCFVTASCDIKWESDQTMILEGHIAEGLPPIEIVKFPTIKKLINRSAEKYTVQVYNTVETSSVKVGFYDLKLPFATDVIIWSHTGVTDKTPEEYPDRVMTLAPGLNVWAYKTLKGMIPKFYKMTCRILNDQPYGNGIGNIEMAFSRYFIHIFEDPGNPI